MQVSPNRWVRAGIFTGALFIFWSIPCLLIASQLMIDAKLMDKAIDPLHAFSSQLLRWWIWVPMTPVIIHLARRFPFEAGRWPRPLMQHCLAALVAALIATAAWTLQAQWNANPKELKYVRFVLFLPVSINWTFATYTAIVASTMALDSFRLRARLQQQLTEARLLALSRQIQPHFLFNTLHTIAGLVRVQRGGDAVEMIARLSDMLRESLSNEQPQQVPLSRELVSADLYLSIQQIRFSDRLEIRRGLADESLNALVPNFLLQPLLENAITHGIAARAGAGFIEIRSMVEADVLAIRITNSGPPLSGGWNLHKQSRVGLRNTCERLEQLYAGEASLMLENGPGDTVTASIRLPWSRA